METNNDPNRKLIQTDEDLVKSKVTEIVKDTVEDTLNALLDAEADSFLKAETYEPADARKDTRAWYNNRKLDTKAG